MKDMGFSLHITDAALTHLAKKSQRSGMGARPLARIFTEEIENPISRSIVLDGIKSETTISVDKDPQKDELIFYYTPTSEKKLSEKSADTEKLHAISEL